MTPELSRGGAAALERASNSSIRVARACKFTIPAAARLALVRGETSTSLIQETRLGKAVLAALMLLRRQGTGRNGHLRSKGELPARARHDGPSGDRVEPFRGPMRADLPIRA